MTTTTSTFKNRARPALENLEDRTLPARTFFILDYSPDFHKGSMYDTFFNVRLRNGYSPAMFDFNGDRRVNATDVQLAANKITGMVRYYYRNYLGMGLTILGGDATRNTNAGYNWLRAGLRSRDQVAVLYLGGRSIGGEFGRAPTAQRGYNVEGFGEAYTRTIAINLYQRNPRATPTQFAAEVATTAAHELGHMMGLQHARSGPRNNIMWPGDTRIRAYNGFYNGTVATEAGFYQNGHAELYYSFLGQRTYYGYVNRGVPDEAPDGDHHEGEDHHGCTCCSCCQGGHGVDLTEQAAPANFNLAVDSPAAVSANAASLAQRLAAHDPAAPARLTWPTTAPVPGSAARDALFTAGLTAPSGQTVKEASLTQMPRIHQEEAAPMDVQRLDACFSVASSLPNLPW